MFIPKLVGDATHVQPTMSILYIVGRVCVPIDITKVEEFDPFNVPTIRCVTQQQPIELSLHCFVIVCCVVKWINYTKQIMKLRLAKPAVGEVHVKVFLKPLYITSRIVFSV